MNRGLLFEQLGPVNQIGGVALEVWADLQALAEDERAELGDHELAAIGLAPHGAEMRPVQTGSMCGGEDLPVDQVADKGLPI